MRREILMIAHELRETVYKANRQLAGTGLVLGTFGNVSAIDRQARLFVIKPSGVPYHELKPDKIVVVSLKTGEPVDSKLRPSSDTPTHLELYRAFTCGAIVHTHSEFATMFAQARTAIRCMGTTQADYFHGDVPVTRAMTKKEVETDYEANTGKVIVETFKKDGILPASVPAVLVANHAPFVWAPDATKAIETAEILEFLARIEWRARVMAPDAPKPDQFLIDKHYLRKHGKNAYYGQSK